MPNAKMASLLVTAPSGFKVVLGVLLVTSMRRGNYGRALRHRRIRFLGGRFAFTIGGSIGGFSSGNCEMRRVRGDLHSETSCFAQASRAHEDGTSSGCASLGAHHPTRVVSPNRFSL